MDDYFVSAQPPQPVPPAPLTSYPPPQAWPSYGAPMGYAPPSPGMPVALKVLVGIGIAVGGFFVLGILAAIAIPVFLNQRAHGVADRTTVDIPSVAAGLPLRTDPASEQMAQRLRDVPIPGVHLAGAYGGTTKPEVLVSVTKRFMSPADQRDFLDGAWRSVDRVSVSSVQYGDIDPGSLGGTVQCTSAPTMTMCFFVDAGAFGNIIVFGTPDRAMPLVLPLRSSVEHRS